MLQPRQYCLDPMKYAIVIAISLLQAGAVYDWQWTQNRVRPYLELARSAGLEWLVILLNFTIAITIWIIVLKVFELGKRFLERRIAR
jgi:hypothetical protein